jgi:hypothetical protein
MLCAHMADARFLKLLEDERRKVTEAMFALSLGDSHGHARLKGVREGLDRAEAILKSVAKLDDEDMSS